MSKRISKSRAFAVVLAVGGELGAYFIHTKQVDSEEKTLEISAHRTPWPARDRDALIELLMKGGLTVRFFDTEERRWMDQSLAFGYVPAPGNRDGTWGPPTSLYEFEEDYLKTV